MTVPFNTLLASLNETPIANLTATDRIPFLNTADNTAYAATVSQIGLLNATVTVTSAQLGALHTTPIDVVPAPGANKVIAPVYVVGAMYNYTAPWSGAVYLGYGSTPEAIVALSFVTATPTANTSSVKFMEGLGGYFNSVSTQLPDSIINGKLTLFVPTAITGGNGTLRLTVYYVVVDIPASV